MRRLLALFVVLFSAMAIANVGTVSASEYSYTYSKFLYQPAPVVPAMAIPGGNFTLYLKGDINSIDSITAVSILHGPYQLHILEASFSKGGKNYAVVAVPDDIVPDDYFLIIKTNKGTLVLPNGLKVFKEWPKTLKLAWVSDTHVTSGSKVGFVCGKYFQRDIYKLEQMCSNPIPLHSVVATDSAYTYWAMKGATLLINTGDEVDTSSDLTGYNIMFNIVKRATAAGLPVVGIKGNHDDPPTIYTQVLGPTYFYVTVGKFIIIGLDTGGDRGYPTMDEIKWMEKVLDEHKGYTPIILYHHPFFFAPRWNYLGGVIKGLDPSTDWDKLRGYVGRYWGANQEVAKRFLEDVVKYNIPLTMSGHIHHDMFWLYIDKNGNKHYFLTLTATGAPDKETNPPTIKTHSPTWYGSNLVVISENGSVSMPYVHVNIKSNKVQSDFMSIPVPQEFIVFRHESNLGSAVKFINELNHTVSGPIVLEIPKGAKVDPSVTNVTYKVVGERQIGDRYYMLVNLTVPTGVSQIVVDTAKDTEKPQVQIAYLQPSRPRPNSPFMAYIVASDNLGLRNLYAVIYDSNGNPVKFGKVTKFPAEPASGKPGDNFYILELPALEKGNYKLEIVAEDFYGNKATITKELSIGTGTTKTTSPQASPTSSTATSPAKNKVCGPAFLVALAVVPLLLRRRK
ncbi:CGP-CTERM sorting domain-containing protein [Thermococcus sp.]|uniref:CGP-CTERM sorting domain-containing protein n=1 Tax=Thermococcus sp. TaxID=35749 RepID=UPI0026027219|nr:CGP-CTERM sorting domain-containing protein [Thermococcus sp.]